jgi:hypothetical protein
MIIIPLFGLVLYVVACVIMAYAGRNGKFAFWGNFWVSVVFTPIIGLIVVLAQDNRNAKKAQPQVAK